MLSVKLTLLWHYMLSRIPSGFNRLPDETMWYS